MSDPVRAALADRLAAWRTRMPANWYGNADLDAAVLALRATPQADPAEVWEAYLQEVPDAECRSLQGAFAFGYHHGQIHAVSADALRDTIARAVYRYQEGPGTFEKPGTMMGELIRQISIDEAENVRRAIMGEPPLPQPDNSDDDVKF